MPHEPLIKDVSDTSFWIAYYRARESEREDALFRDPLAKRLIGERGKAISDSMPSVGRYTEWSVVSRTVIIDRFIEKLVKGGADAVINLGAGLDARPYRMELPEALEWIEVDFPAIIEHKNRSLAAESPRCSLKRVGLDLVDSAKRRAFLADAAPRAKKVLILTEGVIPYLSPEQVAELARDLLALPRFTFWIAEYFNPRVYPHLQSSLRQARMKNAPFKFYPEDWFGFFRERGWIEKESAFTGEIAAEFGRKPPMPWWASLVFPLLPKRLQTEALRMTGFVVFERETA